MSLFDIGTGILSFIGCVAIAAVIIAWYHYQDFRRN